jgi:hypothetical protein
VCALVGALSNGIIAFVLPPLFMMRLHGKANLSCVEWAFNVFLVVFGVFGSIYGAATVIIAWVGGG